MSEHIIIDKKVLFDLISHIACVADDAATGVICTQRKCIPETFAFVDSDKLPCDLRDHVELVLSGRIRFMLEQPDVLATAKIFTNYVSQAVLHEMHGETNTAQHCIENAEGVLPDVQRAIAAYSKQLHK